MKLLYGTTNPAKLQSMKRMLEGLNIEIIGLNDINLNVGQIDESGNNPIENAKIKAAAYYEAAKMPVFSCDSGLYIEGLENEKQPGVHVRRVNGKTLNDEEMIEYYSGIASKLGGEVLAKYQNSICLIIDDKNIFEYDGEDIADFFLITSKPHPKRTKGFPLDSISLNIKTRKYFGDMDAYCENSIVKGFRNFFANINEFM